MTKGELFKLDKRIDEINEALDLCTNYDDDVRENLEKELDEIENKLELSMKKAVNMEMKQMFKRDLTVTFRHPKFGRIKAKVLSTEYLAQSGWTVALLPLIGPGIELKDSSVMYINEKFLNKLLEKAA